MRGRFALMLASLLGFGAASPVGADTAGLDFSRLSLGAGALPPLESYQARDGAVLQYRHYPSESSTVLVLIHGSGSDSRYLSAMAGAIAKAGAAEVYTPDVRGHGPSPIRRGDIDHIGQLEEDLADLIAHIKSGNKGASVVVGGHSSGGGLAVRFAGGPYGDRASGYLLLAPFLGHDAPTVRENSGGWARPNLFRIIPISILNQFGVTLFNQTKVLEFNMPAAVRDGSETLSYSYRLMTGFGPEDYRDSLAGLAVPLLLLVGSDDEALFADKFEATVRPLVPDAEIETVEGASHLGIVGDERAIRSVREWLSRF